MTLLCLSAANESLHGLVLRCAKQRKVRLTGASADLTTTVARATRRAEWPIRKQGAKEAASHGHRAYGTGDSLDILQRHKRAVGRGYTADGPIPLSAARGYSSLHMFDIFR